MDFSHFQTFDHAFPFPELGTPGHEILDEAMLLRLPIVAVDSRLRAATTNSDFYGVVWGHLVNQAIEFTNAVNAFAVDAQDDVVFAQPAFSQDYL